MGGKSGGGSDQTTTVTPWAAQQPYLQHGFEQARSLYDGGAPQFFPGATYTPFSGQTELGMGLMQQRAMGGSPLTGAAQGLATDSLNSRPSAGYLQDFIASRLQPGAFGHGGGGGGGGGFSGSFHGGGGAPSMNMGQLAQYQQSFLDQLTGIPQATLDTLTNTANGDFLNGNPYLDATYGRAADQVTSQFNENVLPNISAQFSMAGRTGSGAQAGIQMDAAGQVADTLSGLSNDIYAGNYQLERDRMIGAANSLGGLSQTQQGLGLQAMGQGSDLFSTLRGQNVSAANAANAAAASRYSADSQRYVSELGHQLGLAQLGNSIYGNQLGQQNVFAGLANGLANQDYADIDRLMGVGSMIEGMGDDVLRDQMSRWNYNQQAPWDNLQRYMGMVQGDYGQTTTQPGQESNPMMGALGGAAAGFQVGGPWGAAIGGLMGLLGGG